MLPLDLNASDVTGYSACLDACNIRMLHAHKAGESLAFYKDLSESHPRALWVYIPMSSGERISEIWVRRGKMYNHLGLLVGANHSFPCSYNLADSCKAEDEQSKTDSHRPVHLTPPGDAERRQPASLGAAVRSPRDTEPPLLQLLMSRDPSP